MEKFQVKITMVVSTSTYISNKQSQHVCKVHATSDCDLVENYEHIEVDRDENHTRKIVMIHVIRKHIIANSPMEAIKKSLPFEIDDDKFHIEYDYDNYPTITFDNNCFVSLSGIELIP